LANECPERDGRRVDVVIGCGEGHLFSNGRAFDIVLGEDRSKRQSVVLRVGVKQRREA
jgi:hypothetical protein